ncbi:MAG: TonB-dependent receptor [Alphaproteobacteria bacterium]|nr:TonB-dependent receptor [Alphaproteobacteria bacterium]MBU1513881.1 TonB-dependent receptor [Alphaproteobacteria bacterium]MBU2094474.1 TonB-dependent receptor [Alphaproteobacteria bacterium]MBU2149800.1 TonB-dependent receptor [Alphaproteobacteria bacterium]MBU2307271.1 TonB-dependent receptor [Alphaproteobacteria bacterium]
MRYRYLLFAAASAASLLGTSAVAQAPSGNSEVEELIVTGTRAAGRSRLESLAPVDVITAQSLQRQGTTELASALAATVPSINFPRPSNTDGTDAVRPATLRGQGPDQTLVLVNGARGHTSALLNLNGSVGRGSAAVDLNAIPSTAIDRIEVLRDGASALYGSDAIAGVINVMLRQADHGGGASVTYGQYLTQFDGFYGRDGHISDGATTTVNGWQGLKLGSDGFLTVSAEYRDRNHTNRSDIDPRVTPLKIRSRFGDGDVQDGSLYLNAGKPLGGGFELFGWAGGQKRHAESAATYRTPTDATQNIIAIYPDGYIPLLNTHSKDAQGGLTLKGEIAGFRSTFTGSYGWNEISYDVKNTLNPSLGPTSPHEFYAGKLIYDQWVGNADFSRDVDVGLAGPLNVAFGVEGRREGYEIGAGEPGSYIRGPFTTLALGSRGFSGFTPSNEIDKHRTNVGAYLALEGKVTDRFTASAAIRQEHYSDFGNNTSGKLSARYEVSDSLAFRASAETGFRAPSLQQQYFTSTAILFVNGVPFETGTYPSVSAVGTALGGQPLKAEKSENYALGAVFRKNGFELTIDAYQIKVDDRIVLSETLTGSATAAPGTNARALFDLLSPLGASAARFFLNGVDTDTKGVDIVAHYVINDDQAGRFDLTAAANINDFNVTKTPSTKQTVLPVPVSLFARQAVLRFEKSAPKWKTSLQGDWSKDAFGATLRTTFYGDVLAPGTLADGSADINTGVRGIVDLEARYTVAERVTLALGADNLFDTYPRQIVPNLNATGAAPFTSFSPFGFNGRFVYGRVSYRW